MKTSYAMLTAAAISAISTVAIAQTTPPATRPNAATPPSGGAAAPAPSGSATSAAPGPAAAAAGTAQSGMRTADTATLAVKFVTMKPADLMSSKIVGVNVYNNQNESVGEIEDLIIDNGKTITGVVVSVGGFLGMGESYVALDPATIVLNQKDGTWKAFVNTSKDNLKNAPKFTYNKKK